MSWQIIKSLKEQRAAKQTEMRTMIETAETEKRNLTTEQATAFNTLRDEERGLSERLERAIATYGAVEPATRSIGRSDIGTPAQQDDEQRAAFNDFCRSGELRASNTITTSTGSGAYVPKIVGPIESAAQITNSLTAAMVHYGRKPFPISGKVTVSVPVISLAAGAAVAGTAESESLSTNTDGSLTLTAATYESKTQWMDNGIIEAVGYDASGSLVPILDDACSRGEEAAFYAASIMDATTKAAARETSTASVISYSDLSALLYDLGAYAFPSAKPAYLVSASTLGAMHSMVDDNGSPVNKLTIRDGMYYWDGTPVFPTGQLEAVAGGKFCAAAVSVAAMGMTASNPFVIRYAAHPGRVNQTGFNFIRYSAFGLKAGAVKLLKVKAA